MALPFPPDDARLAALRDELPATGAGIYLNTGSAGPLPRPAAEAMSELAGWELRTGRATLDYFLAMLERMDEVRAAIAAVITADLDEVALTNSTSQSMAIATWAAGWRPGDRAVTTTGEHAGALGPLYALRDRADVDLAFVDVELPDEASLLEAFDRAITPGTRLVSVSHVAWTTGVVLPVRAIAEVARSRDALFVVDGAQAVGAMAVEAAETGADLYAVAGQKWLLGPEGIAALWVRSASLDRLHATVPGYLSYDRIDSSGTALPWPTARRFDAPNFYKPSIVGLGRSVGWLSMTVGLEAAYERAATLARATAARLAGIDGVSVLTPLDRMATLVTFRIVGWSSEAALDELGGRVFAIARTIPELDAIRISVGWFNDAAELERFAATVELLAAHRPETIPRRPRLEVLGGKG